MSNDESARKTPPREGWPRAATVITSLAVATTVGLAMVIYVLSVAGGAVRGRLVALLPVYFIAAFFSTLVVFWALHAIIAWFRTEFGDGTMGAREHGFAVILTFLAVSVVHYVQGQDMQRLLQERGGAAAQAGSCPERVECLPPRSADALSALTGEERRRMAERGRLTAEGFALLMRDADPQVRALLAGRGDLPEELLERLAGDRAAAVREGAAASPRMADQALNRLAFDREESVRLAVARNRNAPPTALDALAGSPSSAIRELVAGHPNASEPVLQRLLTGRTDRAEQVAQERLRSGKVR